MRAQIIDHQSGAGQFERTLAEFPSNHFDHKLASKFELNLSKLAWQPKGVCFLRVGASSSTVAVDVAVAIVAAPARTAATLIVADKRLLLG